MITHVVLFMLKDGVSADGAAIEQVHRAMRCLPERIAVIRSWRHGFNQTADGDAADYGLVATFDSQDDLHAYFEHPAHVEVLEMWSVLADLRFADLNA